MSAAPIASLAGRTALVTGGGSGIGAALVRALVAEGAHVVCADIDEEAAQATVSTLAGPGAAEAIGVDVTDAGAVATAIDDVVARHGRLNLLFNNAGITFFGNTEDLTLEQWDQIIDVNVRGVVHGIHAAYPAMIAAGGGHIVNTASMGGLLPGGLMASYVATKHAVVGLSLSLRQEAAAHNVGVTVVCPAAVDTPILDKGEISGLRGRDYYLDGQGIKRPVDPDDLARAVLRGVLQNKAWVVEPAQSRWTWRLGRIAPGLIIKAGTSFVARQRAASSAR